MVGLGQTGENIGRRTVGRDGRSWALSTHLLGISHFYIIRYFVTLEWLYILGPNFQRVVPAPGAHGAAIRGNADGAKS